MHKVTKFLSEISTFFRKNDSDHAMFAIMDVIKGIRMNELMYHIASQLWTKVIVRSDHKFMDTCLMIDDTDFPKTGRRMENIGRVHSHLEHRSILGFKALFLGITDGISQMLVDFAILGEKAGRVITA